MKRRTAWLAIVAMTMLLFGLGIRELSAQGTEVTLESLQRELALLQHTANTPPGKAIYRAACADCHGLHGDGWGPGAHGFAQRATDFTKGIYKLRSTTSEIPAAGDLERTIRVGMPGTEMVPFGDLLTEASIAAVTRYIRGFSETLRDPTAMPDEEEMVEIPAKRPFERTEQTIAEGKQIYEDQACADCHGEQGRGSEDETDDWDFPVVMMSFRDGVFKSGPNDADLYRSIATGMKGTSMENYREEASEEEIWKLVDYIRSLDARENEGFLAKLLGYFLSDRPSGLDYTTH